MSSLEEIDPQLSKRPIPKFRDPDKRKISVQKQLKRVTAKIARLEERSEYMDVDPNYLAMVQESKRRMIEIALKRMSVPVQDTLAHAEIVGQFNEHLRLTEERLRVKSQLQKLGQVVEGLKKTLAALFKRQDERRKDARARNTDDNLT